MSPCGDTVLAARAGSLRSPTFGAPAPAARSTLIFTAEILRISPQKTLRTLALLMGLGGPLATLDDDWPAVLAGIFKGSRKNSLLVLWWSRWTEGVNQI